MGLETYQKAKQMIQANEELADFVGERTIEIIKLAEEKLGVKFTGFYLDYLQTYGAGNFGSQEIFGMITADFENSSIPDAVWYTLTERKESNLPDHLLIIHDTGRGELYCLDFNQLDGNGEPKVVSFYPGIELVSQNYEIVAHDFGDLLLDLVKQEV